MKGPLLFLVAVVAAAGFGVAILKPAIGEREELRADVRTSAAAGPAVPATLEEAKRRLARVLGPADGPEGWEEVRELVRGYARDGIRPDEAGALAFETDFARLASLLGALEPLAGSVGGVRVEGRVAADLCAVVVTPAGADR